MTVIIFVGPSLPVTEARSLLEADYRPPAKAGDIYAATLQRPQAIGLIDGLFEAVPAVWHKEILHALAEGIHVYGASSMGALRGAELQAFGMKGVGHIFDAFAHGELEDDDEVALIHAPKVAGYRPLSEPMVNIREGLRRALCRGLISQTSHDLLIGLAKAQFYPERAWASLARLGTEAGGSEQEINRLLEFVAGEPPDLKREDARQLVRRIADDLARGLASFEADFRLERSIFFHRLAEAVEQAVAKDSD